MNLTTVTISGADDAVQPAELVALSREFPFVEWGLLFSLNRRGTPRYPSREWLVRLLKEGPTLARSYHLCGQMAREALTTKPELLGPYPGVRRVQVNAPVSTDVFGSFYRTVRSIPETEVILQASNEQSLEIVSALSHNARNVVALFDPSGGTGKPGTFTYPTGARAGLRVGWAGGIGPDNVVQVIERLLALPRDGATWIDMESGVRTDDKLDLEKVRTVLERARPYVTA